MLNLSPEELLARYISINSSQELGGKTDITSEFLRSILDSEKLECEIFEAAPGKTDLLAKLPGKTKSPVILMHHMDVVRGEPGQFTGEIRGGYVWGRGAIDDKGLGIIHLKTFLSLAGDARKGLIELRRPVWFLAVCDEEIAGSAGAHFMIEKIFGPNGIGNELEEPPIVLDEGGYWLSDILSKPICNIAVCEKSQMVLKLTFRNQSGHASHGSVPPRKEKEHVKLKAAKAVEKLAKSKRPLRLNEASREFIGKVRKLQKFPVSLLPPRAVATLASLKSEKIYAMTHDTIGLTLQKSDADINVIPSRIEEYLDIRLLPDSDPTEMIEFVRNTLTEGGFTADDFQITVERNPIFGGISPTDHFAMKAVKDVLRRYHPEAIVTSSICPGFTDSRFFRAIGALAYGMVPVMFTEDEVENIHGPRERMPIDGLHRGIEIMNEVVRAIATAPDS